MDYDKFRQTVSSWMTTKPCDTTCSTDYCCKESTYPCGGGYGECYNVTVDPEAQCKINKNALAAGGDLKSFFSTTMSSLACDTSAVVSEPKTHSKYSENRLTPNTLNTSELTVGHGDFAPNQLKSYSYSNFYEPSVSHPSFPTINTLYSNSDKDPTSIYTAQSHSSCRTKLLENAAPTYNFHHTNQPTGIKQNKYRKNAPNVFSMNTISESAHTEGDTKYNNVLSNQIMDKSAKIIEIPSSSKLTHKTSTTKSKTYTEVETIFSRSSSSKKKQEDNITDDQKQIEKLGSRRLGFLNHQMPTSRNRIIGSNICKDRRGPVTEVSNTNVKEENSLSLHTAAGQSFIEGQRLDFFLILSFSLDIG